LLTVAPASAQPQPPDPTKLTLDRLFASDEFRGDRIPPVKWLDGGEYTTLQPSKVHKHGSDIVRFDATGKSEVLVPAEKLVPTDAKEPLAIKGYELSQDLDLVLIYTNSVKVWRQETRGDYWTYRRSTGKLTRLGGDAKPSTLMFAKLSPDSTLVGYVRENNLFVEPAGGGPATRLTSDGSNEVINGSFDWVYEEEFSCRDGWRWSPDGKQIAYWQLDSRGVKTFTLIDNTTATYPILKTFAYPKTGERNSACRVGVVAATGGATRWIDVPGDTRTDYYIPRMEWAGNAQELAIQRINRVQNAVHVMLADVTTGTVRTVLTERDGTWVDIHDDVLKWVENRSAFTWISERDGWRHLYLASRDGTTVRRVTSGEFDVIRVLHIDEKAGRVYFLASPENPTQHYLYTAALNGSGTPARLSPVDQPGTHDYAISLDGAFAVHTWSAFGKPARIELVSLPAHKVVRTVAANEKLRETVGKLTQSPVEFFKVDIGGGVKLDGWVMKPPGFDPAKKYPLLFYVYGEPAGQSVSDRWGGNQYLWHLLLTQQGYVVACVDNRGTPCPRGRDWRKAVYRRVGTLAAEDQVAAARELLKRPYLDGTRVGAWGWSGGGSTTLNLLFRYPDVYRTGMSVAAVPDMRLYNTIYQERYMGLPQHNAEDYKHGSPITHAAGLKGNLLLVHGSGDDNCHAQGMEKLADRLIELNKQFTLMVYPNRSHSIDEGKTTSRHLYGLLTQYLNDNLPAGPKQLRRQNRPAPACESTTGVLEQGEKQPER
jgi:dipeptidyl-peptidase-4